MPIHHDPNQTPPLPASAALTLRGSAMRHLEILHAAASKGTSMAAGSPAKPSAPTSPTCAHSNIAYGLEPPHQTQSQAVTPAGWRACLLMCQAAQHKVGQELYSTAGMLTGMRPRAWAIPTSCAFSCASCTFFCRSRASSSAVLANWAL